MKTEGERATNHRCTPCELQTMISEDHKGLTSSTSVKMALKGVSRMKTSMSAARKYIS